MEGHGRFHVVGLHLPKDAFQDVRWSTHLVWLRTYLLGQRLPVLRAKLGCLPRPSLALPVAFVGHLREHAVSVGQPQRVRADFLCFAVRPRQVRAAKPRERGQVIRGITMVPTN